MRAKICGITTVEDALLAVQKGAWALGFNFYYKSPRNISRDVAKNIIKELPSTILKVGIFVDESIEYIKDLLDEVQLDFAQVNNLFAQEDAIKRRMILSLQHDNLPAHSELASYGYILLDAPRTQDGLLGGTGRLSNWNLARQLSKKYRLILAGGLTAQNIEAAIKAVRPYAVDVATGVERAPGIKDENRLTQFLEECHNVE